MNLKRIDVLSIVSMVAMCSLLGCVGLKQQSRSRTASNRMVCVNNLKQIGLWMRIEVRDFDQYLMSYSVSEGGTREWVEAGEIWRHHRLLLGELTSPQILTCPDDSKAAAVSWDAMTNNEHISYFLGLDTAETRSNMLLSGDRNIALNGKRLNGVVALETNSPIQWTANDVHRGEGNIGYADGSVQQFTTKKLRAALVNSGDSTNRLVFP